LAKRNEEPEQKRSQLQLEWRDYVAMILAILETNLLPVILLILAIFLLTVILGFIF